MKAFASDYDGTLFFRSINGCKEEDLKAIQNLQHTGALFGICTGRPFEGIRKFISKELKPDFFIVSSGAAILNKNYEVIYEKPLGIEVAEKLCGLYDDVNYMFIHAGHNVFAYKKAKPDALVSRVVIEKLDEIADKKIYGLSYSLGNEDAASDFANRINTQFKEQCAAFQNKDSVDVVSKGCSKGESLLRIKELMNVEYCYGIGDSFNDIPMLIKADTSFTFHRCDRKVKEHADYVVDSVAEAIEQYIL